MRPVYRSWLCIVPTNATQLTAFLEFLGRIIIGIPCFFFRFIPLSLTPQPDVVVNMLPFASRWQWAILAGFIVVALMTLLQYNHPILVTHDRTPITVSLNTVSMPRKAILRHTPRCPKLISQTDHLIRLSGNFGDIQVPLTDTCKWPSLAAMQSCCVVHHPGVLCPCVQWLE